MRSWVDEPQSELELRESESRYSTSQRKLAKFFLANMSLLLLLEDFNVLMLTDCKFVDL